MESPGLSAVQMNAELESFRQKWREEVSANTKGKQSAPRVSFQYEPLQHDQIRLLRLSDNSNSEPAYILESFDFITEYKRPHTLPSYNALSYTWGPPNPTRTISLNGMSFEVRENLASFLDHNRNGITILDENDRRLSHRIKYLWIDQLCIDQSSQEEKSHQVQRMAQIYTRANEVTVWLGAEDDDSGTAMRLLADTWYIDISPHGPRSSFGADIWQTMKRKNEDSLQRLSNNRRSIERLLCRSYWSRLWVVQEFVLARDLVLACGPCAITLDAISRLRFTSSSAVLWGYTTLVTIPEPVATLLDARKDLKSDKAISYEMHLITLLRDFSMRQCEDPRDKVYGLVALCRGGLELTIRLEVDYSKLAVELFWEIFSASWARTYFRGHNETWFIQLAKNMGALK
jgi:hypothetical protein